MEKCGKVWRREDAAAVRREALDEVCSFAAVGGAREMRACSACAGDYEDPDSTAWAADDAEEEERDGAESVDTKEFPAEE